MSLPSCSLSCQNVTHPISRFYGTSTTKTSTMLQSSTPNCSLSDSTDTDNFNELKDLYVIKN